MISLSPHNPELIRVCGRPADSFSAINATLKVAEGFKVFLITKKSIFSFILFLIAC